MPRAPKVERVIPEMVPGEMDRFRQHLQAVRWIFAKTMPENPHEYTLRKEWRTDSDFEWAVTFIRTYGYRSKYGGSWYTQMDCDGHFYWTMGCPINKRDGTPYTILINRKILAPKAEPDAVASGEQVIPRDSNRTETEGEGQGLLTFAQFKSVAVE